VSGTTARPRPHGGLLTPAATRALIDSNAREAADLVGELTLLLDRAGADREALPAARMVTRRLSDRIAQVTTLERLANLGGYRPDAWSPIELLEELEHEAVALAGERIDVRVAAPDLVPQYWFFDRELVTQALVGALHSALAHAVRSVSIGCGVRDGCFGFSVEDDAGAFPLELVEDDESLRLERGELNGNALGVHFARVVAMLHVNAGQHGRVELRNRADVPGTRFTLWLP
jgi:hypothetical protein